MGSSSRSWEPSSSQIHRTRVPVGALHSITSRPQERPLNRSLSWRHPNCYDCVGSVTISEGQEAVGRESNMTIYISQGRYTAAAIRAMTAKPENRSDAIAAMLAAPGGRLIRSCLPLGREHL